MASCKLLAWLIGFEMLKLLFPKICRPNSVVVALSRLDCRPNSCLELFQMVGFHPTFSRHGRIDVNIILLIWLNENVGLRYVSFHHEYLARLKFSAAKILHIIITVFAPSNLNFGVRTHPQIVTLRKLFDHFRKHFYIFRWSVHGE